MRRRRSGEGLDALRADVDEDASFWVDGSSKDFKGLSADERALLNAGELVAFQRGLRPMCMVQLWTGWNDDEVGDQNIDLPYVVRLLREVIEDEKIEAITTAPPNATDAHGLRARVPEPIAVSRARRVLASFGAQAALVAGSPYYQTLIGRCLGYKEENMRRATIQQGRADFETRERLGRRRVAEDFTRASDEDGAKIFRRLNEKMAKKKKSKRRTSSVENVEMMFGRRRNR